ncbi:MAG: DUF7146 domain-containing protein [Polynucleobacter sp.]
MTRAKTADLARRKWRGILLQLGIDARFLTGKHGPCPMCEGTDRFRFDDKDGSGSFFCSGCGPGGSGFELLQRLNGWDFAAAASEVDKVIGRVQPEPAKPAVNSAKQRDDKNRLWRSAVQIGATDPTGLYLAHRGLSLPTTSDVLRFASYCPAPGEVGGRPAMLAKITGADGRPVNLHRTFLTPAGRKADMDQPRATMPGDLPDGCAIRLGPIAERMGIAEGIETALAASQRFGLPVWAAINATMLAKWRAPEGCKHVTVFIDNDVKFGGQAAGFTLSHRLACRDHLDVEPKVAPSPGTDWADLTMEPA